MRVPALIALTLASGTAFAGAKASDFRKENRRGANFWAGQNTIDGKMDTAWMVPGESENKGETLTLDVPKMAIDKIGMVVGFAKDDDTFADFARVKKIRIEAAAYDGPDLKPLPDSREVEFEDKPGMQVVDFEDIVAGENAMGGKVTVTVLEVYPGRDYPNFAVSEVLLYLAEFDVAAKVMATSNDDEMVGLEMLDDNSRTAWKAPAEGAGFTFGAGGFSLSQVGLQSADKGFARPKKVEITANGRSSVQTLNDSTDLQWLPIPAITGYTGSAWGDIELKVLETYPGSRSKDTVAISELKVKATNSDGL